MPSRKNVVWLPESYDIENAECIRRWSENDYKPLKVPNFKKVPLVKHGVLGLRSLDIESLQCDESVSWNGWNLSKNDILWLYDSLDEIVWFLIYVVGSSDVRCVAKALLHLENGGHISRHQSSAVKIKLGM